MAAELTAVLFALRREAVPFCRQAGCTRRLSGPCPAWAGDGVAAMVTGVGSDAAGRAADWVLAHLRPRRVVSAGFCGSLVAGVGVGEVLRPTVVVEEATGAIFRAYRGDQAKVLVSVAAPVATRADRERLHRRTGAQLVDMESAAIARRCAAAGVPFEAVRAVSDDLDWPLPAELPAVVEGERVRPAALAVALLRRPLLAVDLVRLARHSRVAARRLAGSLAGALAAQEAAATGSA